MSSAVVPAARWAGCPAICGDQPFTPIIESLHADCSPVPRRAATWPPLSPGAPGSPSSGTCGHGPRSAGERSFGQLRPARLLPLLVASANRASPRQRRMACSMRATSGCAPSGDPRTPALAASSRAACSYRSLRHARSAIPTSTVAIRGADPASDAAWHAATRCRGPRQGFGEVTEQVVCYRPDLRLLRRGPDGGRDAELPVPGPCRRSSGPVPPSSGPARPACTATRPFRVPLRLGHGRRARLPHHPSASTAEPAVTVSGRISMAPTSVTTAIAWSSVARSGEVAARGDPVRQLGQGERNPPPLAERPESASAISR